MSTLLAGNKRNEVHVIYDLLGEDHTIIFRAHDQCMRELQVAKITPPLAPFGILVLFPALVPRR